MSFQFLQKFVSIIMECDNLLNQVPANPAALLKSKLLSAQSKVSFSHL